MRQIEPNPPTHRQTARPKILHEPIDGRPRSIGHGVGLRRDHFERILAGPTRIDWFEAISENFMVPGGRPLDVLTRVRVRTTNGDITIQGALADGGRLDGETVNGDVEVILADISNLSVNVETFNGDIDHCFDAEVERKSRYGPGRELRLSRGDGQRSVRVKTLNGDVEICNLSGGER